VSKVTARDIMRRSAAGVAIYLRPCRRSTKLVEQSFTQCLTFDQDVAQLRSIGARRFELQFGQVVVQQPDGRLHVVVEHALCSVAQT